MRRKQKQLELLTIPGVPLPPRMVSLYACLRFFADENRNCEATRYGLARMIGLRSYGQVSRLLHELRRLRLVEWTRGPQSKISLRDWGNATSTYHVLEPDEQWIRSQLGRSEDT